MDRYDAIKTYTFELLTLSEPASENWAEAGTRIAERMEAYLKEYQLTPTPENARAAYYAAADADPGLKLAYAGPVGRTKADRLEALKDKYRQVAGVSWALGAGEILDALVRATMRENPREDLDYLDLMHAWLKKDLDLKAAYVRS